LRCVSLLLVPLHFAAFDLPKAAAGGAAASLPLLAAANVAWGVVYAVLSSRGAAAGDARRPFVLMDGAVTPLTTFLLVAETACALAVGAFFRSKNLM
jgi:hypothetical protein